MRARKYHRNMKLRKYIIRKRKYQISKLSPSLKKENKEEKIYRINLERKKIIIGSGRRDIDRKCEERRRISRNKI